MSKISLKKSVYFYDDRSKDDSIFKLDKILFSDKEVCLCTVTSTDPEFPINEKLLFNLDGGEVLNTDFYSWIATNKKQ